MKPEAQRQANSARPELDNYEIDLGRGFLPAPDPLDHLPDDFSPLGGAGPGAAQTPDRQ